MTHVQAMADLLEVFGIEIAFADRRVRLASILVAEGFTLDQIEAVGREIEHSAPRLQDAPPILFAALTADLAALRARAASCQKFLAARAARAAGMRPGDDGSRNVMPTPPPPAGPSRDCRVAWALVIADRRPLAEAAAIMGRTEAEVRALIDQERAERKRDGATMLPSIDKRSGEVKHPKLRGGKSVFQQNEDRDRDMDERRRKAFGDAYAQAGRPMPSNVYEMVNQKGGAK